MTDKKIKFMIDSLQARKDYLKMQLRNNVINENEYKQAFKEVNSEYIRYKKLLKKNK